MMYLISLVLFDLTFSSRNNVKRGTNPFMTDARVTAFELQM